MKRFAHILFDEGVLASREVSSSSRVECVGEEKALLAFLDFLESVAPLVGLDEGTVGVLLEKLLAMDKVKLESLVDGFTWWERILANSNNQCE